MSKSEILEELPKLKAEERREIFERICEMEELALLNGFEPSTEEKQCWTVNLRSIAQILKRVRRGMKWRRGYANPACELASHHPSERGSGFA